VLESNFGFHRGAFIRYNVLTKVYVKTLMMKRLLLCSLAALSLITACDKKEILTGKREEIAGVTAIKRGIPSDRSTLAEPLNLTPPVRTSAYTDIAYNKQHNSPNHENVSFSKLVWESSLGRGPINSNIVISAGYIYAIDAGGTLICISQADGKKVWEKPIARQPDEAVFSGGLTIENGILYIATNIGTVHAIDSRTQKEVWDCKIKYPLKGAPLFVAGKVIVTSIINHIFAINARSGTVEWTMAANDEQTTMADAGTPAVFGDSVICPCSSGDVKAFNIHTGTENWDDMLYSSDMFASGAVISHIVVSPLVFGRYVLVVTSEAKMVLLDAASGNRVWELEIGTMHPPVENNGWIFMLTSSDELLCISSRSGAIRWASNIKDTLLKDGTKAEDLMVSGPLLINGDVVVFSNTGSVLVMNASTGNLKAQLKPEAFKNLGVIKTPVIVDRFAYVVSQNGDICKVG
jgi:outer membrane protein assembly factor BamB